jgi:hypothetical protein
MIANSGSDLMLYKIADYTAAKASSDLILEICDRETQPLRFVSLDPSMAAEIGLEERRVTGDEFLLSCFETQSLLSSLFAATFAALLSVSKVPFLDS